MRADKRLALLAGSRTKAQDLIKAGKARVNGIPIKKGSQEIKEEDLLTIDEDVQQFASRAAWKLKAPIEQFNIDLNGKTVLDIGASTGGFTDICLQAGAKKVYALDVGHGQLADFLQEDGRVVNMEGTNARDIRREWFDPLPDLVCMDVSFISSRTILDALFAQFVPDELILLVKPQFECGPQYLNNSGVLKDEKKRRQIIDTMKQYLLQFYADVKLTQSILPGRSGNQEAVLAAGQKRSKG